MFNNMSNMGQFNNKTGPWGRSNTSPNVVNQGSMQPTLMNQGALGNMGTSGLVQFQQPHQQVFQNAMGLPQQNLGLGLQQMANATLNTQIASNPIFQQVGAVSYPNPRGLNPAAFQTPNISAVPPVQSNSNSGTKQRVFTGTVTKVHDNFGFVDEDVFFQTNACVQGSNPIVGDRVLVEASYNPSMPFKWNATRIQVLPMTNQPARHSNTSKNYSNPSAYNAVPPPSDAPNGSNFGRNNGRQKASLSGRGRERSRDKDEEEIERKRRREERLREREKEEKKSPIRRRSRSPKSRRRSRIVPRYMVQIPKIALDLSGGDVLEIRRRYSNIYIPSDFFFTQIRWVDAFPPDKPFTLNKPCSFHIMNKEIDPVIENTTMLEPPDADYIFSAKVMLMSVPGTEELYKKCCAMAEDKDRRDRDSEDRDFVHPTRLINFLVGLRGKNETMAIGGPWSPSLDGENPQKDPSVLINTAIRTCKALTGIDLSNCTQWYRFVELYYRRSETTHKGKAVPARVETVVLFLPDIWSCLPTRLEWDVLHQTYRKQLERILKVEQQEGATGGGADDSSTADEKEEEPASEKLEPTHYSQLDPKSMIVSALRIELKARNISWKGLKSQLVARLAKALKSEAEKMEGKTKEDPELDTTQDEKKTEVEEKKLDEREKALLEKQYTLPEQQHVLVYPSKTAKSGKFDCTTMSLSLLLDYRPEDTKEHSFEVSLFAELFNEMLMRDFGFNIFRALHELPEKAKDKEEKTKKKEDISKKNDDKKDEDKKKDDEKKKEYNKEKKENAEKQQKSQNEECDDKKLTKESDKEPKKDERKSDESEEEDEAEDDEEKEKKKSKDKKKKEKVKLYTKDKHLLLSFVYFDQTHCGYIFDKDIEDLLYTLGLNLSRAQVRKLVSKVVTRDSLHYRKLTDKPKEEDLTVMDPSEKNTDLHRLAFCNKKLLPIFTVEHSSRNNVVCNADYEEGKKDGLVMFRGSLVDVSKLISQLERSEKARLETEARMVDLKGENHKLVEKYTKSNSTIRHLNCEVKEYKEKLQISEESLNKVTGFSKLVQSTLLEVKEKIDPLLKSVTIKQETESIKKEKEEKGVDRDKKHEDSKSRWEKEAKMEESVDVDMNDSKET